MYSGALRGRAEQSMSTVFSLSIPAERFGWARNDLILCHWLLDEKPLNHCSSINGVDVQNAGSNM